MKLLKLQRTMARAVMQPLTATERMRQHRTRRRNGLHCITVLLHEDDIDVLIGKGFLREDRRRNHRTLEHALNVFICEALGPG